MLLSHYCTQVSSLSTSLRGSASILPAVSATMFNQPCLHTTMSIDQIHLDLWTRAHVRQVLESAAENQEDSENMQLFLTWLDDSIQKPLAPIKQYLDDDPRIDGVTIGEPIEQPEYACLCRDLLRNKIIEAGEMYYCPPLSPARTNIECLTDWIWICAVK